MAQHPPTDILEQRALTIARERSDDGGVWSHSSDRAYVIFCVGQEDWQIRRFLKWALESGLGFKPLRGCYQGQEERSFIVNMLDLDKITPFINGEESILLLHDYNARDVPKATLLYLATGRRVPLGHYVTGSVEVKKRFDSWTFDPLSGNYFVTTA